MEINLTKYIKILAVFIQFNWVIIAVHFQAEMSNADKDVCLKMCITVSSITGIKSENELNI